MCLFFAGIEGIDARLRRYAEGFSEAVLVCLQHGTCCSCLVRRGSNTLPWKSLFYVVVI